MVANPRAVRHFAQAMMKRSKNDELDAEVLREFAQRMPFVVWTRPSESLLALWAIARRLEALTDLCTAEKNRRHAAGLLRSVPAVVRQDSAASLRFHQRALRRLRQQALRQIRSQPALAQRFELLRSIRGIGDTSAVQLLAELMLLPPDRDVRVGGLCGTGSAGIPLGIFGAQAHQDQQGGQPASPTRVVHARPGRQPLRAAPAGLL